MKYCKEYAALLDSFVDGELLPDEMERVLAHLENCPDCQAYVDDALAIRAGFPEVESTIVPEGFAEGVMECIRAEERKGAETRRQSVRRWTRTLAALAACCALVLLVKTGGFDGSAPVVTTAGDLREEAETSMVYSAAASPDANMDAGEDCGAGEDAEFGIAPQMEPAANTEEDGAEMSKIRTTAGKEVDFESRVGIAPSPALTEDASENASADAADESVLYLTADEAGSLLDGVDPVWESAGERHYELNAEEFQALLEALGRQKELPVMEEAAFFVVVSE